MASFLPTPSHGAEVRLTAVQLFALADEARDKGDYATAETAYLALAGNPDRDLRNEARFRLAIMRADRQHKYRDAAVVLRQILDETPGAARVRLELARVQALLGHTGAASRELRAAQAAGLPPQVEQAVRFYAQALDARRPLGGSLEVTLAPDSNINHATASPTLGTVIGNFDLSRDAQARSGLGGALRGQGFVHLPVGEHLRLLAQISGSANLYRSSEFSDVAVSPQAGPEVNWGRNRLTLTAGPGWRWYGGLPYTLSLGGAANWQRAVGKRGQMRLDATYTHLRNRRDDLQSGTSTTLAIGVDRALSARFGGGLQVIGARMSAHDPAYSTDGLGLNAYFYREMGRTTASVNLAYNHLAADDRLFLFADRRIDNSYSASVSATFRRLRVGSIAPLARLRFERNVSSVQLYDYRRFAGEVGLTTAF